MGWDPVARRGPTPITCTLTQLLGLLDVGADDRIPIAGNERIGGRELIQGGEDRTADIRKLRSEVSRDLEALRLSMTIRLGSMLFLGLGLLFAALKLT